jgi:hypothetical protein
LQWPLGQFEEKAFGATYVFSHSSHSSYRCRYAENKCENHIFEASGMGQA